MIKILGSWGITADNYNYVAGRLTTRTDKKTGQTTEAISQPRYYGTLLAAVRAGVEDEKRGVVQTGDITLSDAIRKLADLEQRIESLLAGAEAQVSAKGVE